jgi:hypothetical protein
MTTSWSALTSHDEAARRAAGRRHYNAWRHSQKVRRQVKVMQIVTSRGWPEHGARAAIARDLGVSRSTISRDIKELYYAPPETPSPQARTKMTKAQLIAVVKPLAKRLTSEDCDCPQDEQKDEPRHELGHVLKFCAEVLDLADKGKINVSPADVRLMERTRDGIVELLRRE